MKTLTLDKPWTYRTAEKTVPYPAGTHEVANEIHAAAVKDGAVSEEKTDGGGAGATGPKGGSRKTEK